MKNRGLFILFEGLDKSGKSTQTQLLCQALNNKNCPSEILRFPNRDTSMGGLINGYLTKEIELEDHAVHLLFSANRWESVNTMKDKLNSGINLIVDRYSYSGVAYSAAKSTMDFEWCKTCEIGLPKPDLICFMDTKTVDMNDRECFGDERYESTAFQRQVYKNFNKLFNLDNVTDQGLLVLDAKDSIESLHEQILNYSLEIINNAKHSKETMELKTLW
jgi:dTMP kinase